MIVVRLIWYGVIFVGVMWVLLDIVIPLITNKPLFSTFRRSKMKKQLIQEMVEQNAELEELAMEKKIAERDLEIESLNQQIEQLKETFETKLKKD